MALLIINENTKVEDLPIELQALFKTYLRMQERKSEFEKLLQKYKGRIVGKLSFDESCRNLAAQIKYVSYRKDKEVFEVRPRVAVGKYLFIGAYQNFDDACNDLKEYLKIKLNETV